MTPVGTHALERVTAAAAEEFETASPAEILRWVDRTFERWAVAASMADTVLAHLAGRVRPGVDVLFLDTGYHFAETVGTADAVEATYPVTLRRVRPRRTVAEQDAAEGPRLYERDPDRCCALRKVEPLDDALAGYQAWVTGVRREESTTRATARVVEWDERRGLVRVNPLARWTSDDVADYAQRHGVLVNPLLAEGYPSIGCEPCTRPVAPGADPRSGRWAGLTKTECGIVR